jgi:hypothetical protein
MVRECTAALTRAAHKRTCRSQERGASVAAGVVDPDRFDEDYRADIGVNFNF